VAGDAIAAPISLLDYSGPGSGQDIFDRMSDHYEDLKDRGEFLGPDGEEPRDGPEDEDNLGEIDEGREMTEQEREEAERELERNMLPLPEDPDEPETPLPKK
jgi:hypothetical protein